MIEQKQSEQQNEEMNQLLRQLSKQLESGFVSEALTFVKSKLGEAVIPEIDEETKAKVNNDVDPAYLELAEDILKNGNTKGDRTGTGTISVFGRMLRFDLRKGFPALTTKKVGIKNIASELSWFIDGDTNIRYLLQHNNRIWVEWPFQKYVESEDYNGPDMTNFAHRKEMDPDFKKVYEEQVNQFITNILEDDNFSEKFGNIGPGAYGAQWRSFDGPDGKQADQLKDVIEQIKNNPDSRRLLVVAWNPVQVKDKGTVLPPCHFVIQFYVVDGKLSCKFIMRSTDLFLGLPYNIASYALLTHLVAIECGLEVDELIFDGGDVHIYSNHLEQIQTQLEREPRDLPTLVIDPRVTSVFDFKPEDATLVGYDPHPAIKAPVAV